MRYKGKEWEVGQGKLGVRNKSPVYLNIQVYTSSQLGPAYL